MGVAVESLQREEDVVFGRLSRDDRQVGGSGGMVGLFINTLPVRVG